MNKVFLFGNLTKDPELKTTASGKNYVRFTIGTRRRSGDQSDFISCIAWEKSAELIAEYFSKGSKIGIEGRLQVSSYETDGGKRYSTDVIVENIEFAQSRKQEGAQQTTAKATPDELFGEELEAFDNPF